MRAFGTPILPFMIPFIVAVLIQITKISIDFFRRKKITWRQVFSSWWFPSVHSGISSSVVALVFIMDGLNSASFAIALVFGFLFVYDAMNLRYETGKHAHYLNSIRSELQDVLHKEKMAKIFKERLGHTPMEVGAGIIIWFVVTFLLTKILGLW